MRKLLFVSLAALALSFNCVVAQADLSNDDGMTIKVQKLETLAVYDVLPAVLSYDKIEAPKTIATYAVPVSATWVEAPRVFRDFRTIADSGGHVKA